MLCNWSLLFRDCSKGLISICGCDQTAQMNNNDPKKYVFSGCSDNVRYGTLSSKEFVDAGDRGKHKNNSVQRAMNLHNNNAGREVLFKALCIKFYFFLLVRKKREKN